MRVRLSHAQPTECRDRKRGELKHLSEMDNAGTYLIYYIDEDLNITPLQTVNRRRLGCEGVLPVGVQVEAQ